MIHPTGSVSLNIAWQRSKRVKTAGSHSARPAQLDQAGDHAIEEDRSAGSSVHESFTPVRFQGCFENHLPAAFNSDGSHQGIPTFSANRRLSAKKDPNLTAPVWGVK
jgi:hypothetical protein